MRLGWKRQRSSSASRELGFPTHCLWNEAGPNECLQRVFEISEMKGRAPFSKELH